MEETKMNRTLKMAVVTAASFLLGAGAVQVLHAQAKPPAYLVAEINVRDKTGYEKEFLAPTLKSLKDASAKYLAGGYDKAVGLSGMPPANRYVIVQFDNMDKAKAWYDGGQRELERTVGSKYGDFRIIAVEGVNQ
jgi:uncharacterized protein (DUF1330 family)